MKILKAMVKVNQTAGGTTYEYPAVWLENKEKFPYIVYPANRGDEVDVDGASCQPVFVCVPDDIVDILKAAGLTDAIQAEFTAFGDKHYPVTEVISDQGSVLPVLIAVANGEKLTDDQLKVLDPNDPTLGITKTKSVLEIAAGLGVTW